MPQISVIVPVYKVEKYLHECVDSILAQTFRDFELILVDDGSPDNCGAICDEYAAKDSRIRVIHQENQGVSAARNAALDAAKGEFIAFVDSDDVVNVHYLEVLLSGMDKDTDIVSCSFSVWSINPVERLADIGEVNFVKYDAVSAIIALYGNSNNLYVTPWGKLYRTETIGEIRFPVGRIHEDQCVIPLICYRARNIACCNQNMYYYRSQPDSITSRTFSLKRFDDIWAIDRCILFFEDKKENAIVSAAKERRAFKLAKYNLLAQKSNVKVPREYRIGALGIMRNLSNVEDRELFRYYLAQLHPKLPILHAYWVKIKKILRIAK